MPCLLDTRRRAQTCFLLSHCHNAVTWRVLFTSDIYIWLQCSTIQYSTVQYSTVTWSVLLTPDIYICSALISTSGCSTKTSSTRRNPNLQFKCIWDLSKNFLWSALLQLRDPLVLGPLFPISISLFLTDQNPLTKFIKALHYFCIFYLFLAQCLKTSDKSCMTHAPR